MIEGHLDYTSGPSVFYRLGDLRPGQTVQVTRADHTTAVFTVDTVRRFPKNDFPPKPSTPTPPPPPSA